MITEVVVPSPDPQLGDRHIKNQRSNNPTHKQSKRAYMIKHREFNKQVRERVCDEPRLMSSVGETIHTVV
jgi:hypothetical protein